MSTHRDALWQIANDCMQSSKYGRRLQLIHNTAMTALGMTLSQRNERHTEAKRLAKEKDRRAFEDRVARRNDNATGASPRKNETLHACTGAETEPK